MPISAPRFANPFLKGREGLVLLSLGHFAVGLFILACLFRSPHGVFILPLSKPIAIGCDPPFVERGDFYGSRGCSSVYDLKIKGEHAGQAEVA